MLLQNFYFSKNIHLLQAYSVNVQIETGICIISLVVPNPSFYIQTDILQSIEEVLNPSYVSHSPSNLICIMHQLIYSSRPQLLPYIIITSIPLGVPSYLHQEPHLHSLELCLMCTGKCPCLAAMLEQPGRDITV